MSGYVRSATATYRLGQVLGRGGTSVVYAAVDDSWGRDLAVKILRPSLDPTERYRLLREARLTRALGHPGVIEVYDAGELEDGRTFLVMERLYGETLAARMARYFWLPIDLVCSIAGQLLSALGAAHQAAIVHRDIKPSNVFLQETRSGLLLVKLIDFGVGRDLADPSTRVTHPSLVVGTIGYLAPEELAGAEPSRRSDIYGLGATLYQMLSGRPPFELDANDLPGAIALMHGEPVPLSELRPVLSPGLAEGVMRALAPDPMDRFSSCDEMAAAVNLEGELAA